MGSNPILSFMNLTTIVKDNKVMFSHLRKGYAYYNVTVNGETFVFPVSLEDIGDATLLNEDKAIIFMRYIRKSIDSKEFIKI